MLLITLGAKISPAGDGVWGADIVVKVTPPTQRELALLDDRTILSFIQVCIICVKCGELVFFFVFIFFR